MKIRLKMLMAASVLASWMLGTLPGCGASSENDSVSASADSLESAGTEGTLLVVALEGATTAMSAGEVAQNAAVQAGRYLVPAGCVSAEASGATVIYVFDRCSGPYGLLQLTGRVTATFANQTNALQVSLTSTGLRSSGAPIDFQSVALYSNNNGAPSVRLTSTSSGTGVRGTEVRRAGDYTATWDDTCLGLDGTWSTTAFGRTWTTTVADFRHCTGRCPEAGGTVTLSGALLGFPITLRYGGDNTAKWTNANGRSGFIPVSCGL